MNESSSKEPYIITRGLRLEIGALKILDKVDFDIHAGQLLGLVGPDGGGKSTLLHICLGRLKATGGEVRVFGAAPALMGERRGWIGYAPQKPFRDYAPSTTAIEFVTDGAFPVDLARRRPPDLIERAAQALDLAEIAALADRPIGNLDIVRFWRVRLARALVNQPKLLILDDLGAGLMAHERLSLFKRLAQIKERLGLAALLVTRDIAPIQDIVGEIVCLNNSVRYRGSPAFIPHDTLTRMYGR